jgi:hypothetical protein
MSKLKQILEHYPEEDFLLADGLDEAIIGVDGKDFRLVYGIEKCIECIAKSMTVTEDDLEGYEKEEGMTLEQKKYELAVEYFYYNTIGAYVGEKTPIFVYENFYE